MNEDTDPLDPLLERWRCVPPAQPESVTAEVWRRIAHLESSGEADEPWWCRVGIAFSRPAFAAAFVAACVVFGLFLAEVRLSVIQDERRAQLERSYLELIDPLFQPRTTTASSVRLDNAVHHR
jgi:hypothetical protein